MAALDAVRDALPDAARDLRLNLGSLLETSSLTSAQRWGVAAACALTARSPRLASAVIADARAAGTSDDVLDDALAAVAIMGMNNVYYRFRHMMAKDTYKTMPARLRMNRLGQAKTSKHDLELFCLAVSAINACEVCMQSHDQVVLKAGVTEEQVHDAIRLAATIKGCADALEASAILGGVSG